jgi:putative transcriptional regulator
VKAEMFAELVSSVREGGSILRGEVRPSRKFVLDVPDIKHIREKYELSQGQFAKLLGISVATLQNWEQGRRAPKGAARVLLQVAAKHPEVVWDVVRPTVQQSQTKNQKAKRVAQGRSINKKVSVN